MSVERAGSAGPGKARVRFAAPHRLFAKARVWFATPHRLFAKGRVR